MSDERIGKCLECRCVVELPEDHADGCSRGPGAADLISRLRADVARLERERSELELKRWNWEQSAIHRGRERDAAIADRDRLREALGDGSVGMVAEALAYVGYRRDLRIVALEILAALRALAQQPAASTSEKP